MASLIMFPVSGVRARIFPLFRRITTVGRSPDADIHIDDPSLEPEHAQLSFDGHGFEVAPLDGRSLVMVNGRKVKTCGLEDLDILRLGRCTLQFQLQDPTQAPEEGMDSGGRGLRKLHELTAALMGESDLQSLVGTLLGKLVEVTHADRGFLFLVQDGEPTLHAARNIDTGGRDSREVLFSDSVVRKVLQTRAPVLVSDALNDQEFGAARSVINYKLCSVMCVPLVARGSLLGILYMGNDNIVNLFTKRTLEVAEIFAAQAALLLRNAILVNELTLRSRSLEEELERIRFGEMIGSSDAMRAVYRVVERVAGTDLGVLITGETGVGKELVARELHNRSRRVRGPFVALNCGAIPENLIESELFGHVRGAFTGAYNTKKGSFQAADGGTLFLDEVGELPLVLQARLLRAIEEKRVTKIGATTPDDVDIRILAATNRTLLDEVAAGRFREDLFYRLNVVVVEVPPLRDRGDDVELIARHLLRRYASQEGREGLQFSESALTALRACSWPGNVREMENRIRKAVVLADGALLEAKDLELEDTETLSLNDARERFQRDYILATLRRNQGNRTRTAHQLGVDPRTIFRYLEKEREDM
ncbi:MAG: sigma 54-interacting transcriptional regulator [Deltaproteobacteria bacterium]|nr:sigma 54-interacting transcriptional regulator [Deltaproteobacteria bacterium]